MDKVLLNLYLFLVFVSCATSLKYEATPRSEYAQVKMTTYRVANNKVGVFLSLVNNVWYEDSVGITQISSIQSDSDGERDTIYTTTTGYRFTDMRRKWIYEYNTLSDTAQITRKYDKADVLQLVGGWNFFRRAAIQFDSLQTIGDTIIAGVTYLKHSYRQNFQGKIYLNEVFSRCDNSTSIFQIDAGVTKATGCPMVKVVTLAPDGKFPMQSVEIEFLANKFPDSIRKVFEAWKRNVTKYPVK